MVAKVAFAAGFVRAAKVVVVAGVERVASWFGRSWGAFALVVGRGAGWNLGRGRGRGSGRSAPGLIEVGVSHRASPSHVPASPSGSARPAALVVSLFAATRLYLHPCPLHYLYLFPHVVYSFCSFLVVAPFPIGVCEPFGMRGLGRDERGRVARGDFTP